MIDWVTLGSAVLSFIAGMAVTHFSYKAGMDAAARIRREVREETYRASGPAPLFPKPLDPISGRDR